NADRNRAHGIGRPPTARSVRNLRRPVLNRIWIYLATACTCLAADLTRATVVAPPNLTGPERKAIALLVDAVRERTRITWPVASADPGPGKPVVRISRPPAGARRIAEGYQLRSSENAGAPVVEITG